MFYSCEKLNSRKKILYFPLRNFGLLYYSGMRYGYNTLSSNLWEVKNKRKFQIFSSKSGHGCSQEVISYNRFQI